MEFNETEQIMSGAPITKPMTLKECAEHCLSEARKHIPVGRYITIVLSLKEIAWVYPVNNAKLPKQFESAILLITEEGQSIEFFTPPSHSEIH